VEIVRLLGKDLQLDVNTRNLCGHSAIMCAITAGNFETVIELLNMGASDEGAMQCAFEHNEFEIAEMLASHQKTLRNT
jgi:ankyrin repeat protein